MVLDRPVLHRAVVPHQEVPDPPLVTIDKGRLYDVIGKRGDQHLGFPSLYSLDPGAIVAHDIEAFALGYGMSPDDRVGDRRVAIYFRLRGRKGPLAPGKVKYRAAPVEVPPHALRQCVPGRGGAGEFCIPQRQAKQFGNFQCMEHRTARRPCGVAHVTVPVLTGPAHADRTAILGHVGNNDDLRTAWYAPSFAEDVELDFAKTAGKSNLLRGRDVLIAEEYDAVIIVGALDSGEHLVVDGSGQVDTANLGAERGARRNDLDRHWRFSCWYGRALAVQAGDTARSVPDTYPARTARERARTVRQLATALITLPTDDRAHLGRLKALLIWRGTGISNSSPSGGESHEPEHRGRSLDRTGWRNDRCRVGRIGRHPLDLGIETGRWGNHPTRARVKRSGSRSLGMEFHAANLVEHPQLVD